MGRGLKTFSLSEELWLIAYPWWCNGGYLPLKTFLKKSFLPILGYII
jgi:hypothetical protein